MPWKKFFKLVFDFAVTLLDLFVPDDDDDKLDKQKQIA